MKKAIVMHPPVAKVAAHFMMGDKIIHTIVEDKGSPGGFSVKLGPGHYMAIPLKSIEEVLQYGVGRGYEAKAVM